MKIEIEILNRNPKQLIKKTKYNAAFKLWHEVWQNEYAQLEPGHKLPSDNFSRQDNILFISIDGEGAALTFFHEVDLSTPMGRLDSYFEPWPVSVLDELEKLNPIVLVCSAFTVSSTFRKASVNDVPVKDLLAAASLHYLKTTSYPVMVGNMRNARGANKVVFKFGAELLQTIICNSEPSDLVVFKKEKIGSFPPAVHELIEQSWESNNYKHKNVPQIAA